MKKQTKTPRTGRPKNKGDLLRGRTVYLSPHQWSELEKTGNPSLTIRKKMAEVGYPEQPITDKTATQ